MKTLLLLLTLLFPDDGLTRVILTLTGATDPSELEVTEIERFESMAARPVRLNGTTSGRLVSSGLMTRYQAASLSDYRARYGDVLSVEELALVDGFNRETARALAMFLDFSPATARDTVRWRSDLTLRASGKDKQGSCGGKYLISGEGKGSAAVAFRRAYDGTRSGTFHLAAQTRRGRIVVGDCNARFGQGLVSWTGFDLSSVTSLASFARRSGGLSPVCSYSGTGALRGIGGAASIGRVTCTSVLAFPGLKERMEESGGTVGLLAVGNASWCGHSGEAGVSVSSAGRFSADGRANLRGVDLFGEGAWDWKVHTGAFRGGFVFPLGEHFRSGLLLNVLPSAYMGKKYGEYAGSWGLDYSDGVYVAVAGKTGFGATEIRNKATLAVTETLLPYPVKDPDRRRLKAVATWNSRISPFLQLSLRSSLTFRNFSPWNRLDFRGDLTASDGHLFSRLRGNIVFADAAPGLLGYLECGYLLEKDSYYIRTTVFRADTWNSRLFSYERDAPGSFTVPAYWGRGCAFSAVAAKKTGKWKVNLRFSVVLKKEKPGSAELKIQGSRSF